MTLNEVPGSEAAVARTLVCCLTCIGVVISSAEWLTPWRKLAPNGLFAKGVRSKSRIETRWRGAGLRGVLVLRCLLASVFITSVLFTHAHAGPKWVVFTLGVLSLPLRTERLGLFDGMDGAEYLSTTICLSLGFTYFLRSHLALESALAFVAFQGLLEYGSAGWIKMRHWREWLFGPHLRQVFGSAHYGQRHLAQVLEARPWVGGCLSALIILLEALMPLTIVLPVTAAKVLLLSALGFHLACAGTMGLNTFVWAFPATYPAILYCRAQIAHLHFLKYM